MDLRQEAERLEQLNRQAVEAAAAAAAAELRSQILRNFEVQPGSAFLEGVRDYVYETDQGTFGAGVVLGDLQSAFVEGGTAEGEPWIWIPLEAARKLRLGRMSPQLWSTLQRRYADRLAFTPVQNQARFLLLNQGGRTVPLYKLQRSVEIPQKLDMERAGQVGFEAMKRIL